MAESGGGKEATGTAPGAPEDLGAQSGTPDVFISYASRDAAVADAVVRSLERAGLKCWIAPRDVVPGALYADEIVRAINEAKVVVLVLSEQAVASPHVGKEIERASSKRRRIVALRTDSAALTRAFEYFLSESQWIDVGSGGIEATGAKLVDAVRRHLAPGADVAPAVPSDPRTFARNSATPQPRWILIASVAVLAVALAYFVVEKFWLSKHATSERPIATVTPAAAPATLAISQKSVAVLPFVDMSQKKYQEYFSDGLCEELIDRLAHSPDLKVIARTSSFQFKGKNEDVRTIGQKLGVANLLEGSVRTSGRSLRVTAQLIRAADGSHLWSQTYDRNTGDIFKVQDSITEAVVTALKAAIAVPTSSVLNKPKNTDAYNAYLRGRYFENKNTKADFERALASYKEAIKLDSRYVDAWVALADVYNDQGLSGRISTKEAYTKAREAIDHALSIDPNSAAAYSRLAAIEENFRWDFEQGTAALKRATELDPAVEAGDMAIWSAVLADRFDDGIALSRQRVQRDPLSAGRLEDLAIVLWWANQFPEAESTLRHLLELNSSFSGAHCELGEVLLFEHRADAALAIMSEEADQDGKWCVANALWALGRRTEADALLAEAKAKYGDTQALGFAQSYARRGEKDEAFKWLNRAYDNREAALMLIRQDQMLSNLRDDPRFTELVRKLKLPE